MFSYNKKKMKLSGIGNDIENKKIKYVDMGEDLYSNDKEISLCTFAICDCIGIVAQTKEFIFLAHANLSKDAKSFEKVEGDKNIKIIKCHHIHNLYNALFNNKKIINQRAEITLIINPLYFVGIDNPFYQIIENDILELIDDCKTNMKLEVIRKPNEHGSFVVVDNTNEEIIIGGLTSDKLERKKYGRLNSQHYEKTNKVK